MNQEKTIKKYHFDKKKADRVIKFISHLTHTKGKWAGLPFVAMEWEKKIVNDVFGTVDENGLRRYRICYVEIPKKNGKTEFFAALSLYMLCSDGEKSPEVYSAAADREQAGLVYLPASAMVRNNTVLSRKLKVLRSRKRIVNYKNNGFYQVLSSDVKTKHGLNPSAVTFDELHAQPNDELWRVLTSGTNYARDQQLILVASTAGIFDINSIWWKIRKKAQQIAAGIIHDESFYAMLYIADSDADPEDETLWKRVNPALGTIFSIEKIRADYQTAKQDPVDLQDFKRYRLDIPIKQTNLWLDMKEWDMCRGTFDHKTLLGQICYGGIDLSATQDLTAHALVFPRNDGPWRVIAHAYCPEDTILDKSRQDKVHYDVWAEEGYITPTPGNYVDQAYLEKDIIKASEDYDLKEEGFDPYAATRLAGVLQNTYGIVMVEMRQGALTLSAPIKDILKNILSRGIEHDGNPVLRWCIDNVVMGLDPNENLRPMKDKSSGRIDLLVALIMAWGRAMVNSVEPQESVYETRGIITL